MDDFISEFLIEIVESFDVIDFELVCFENNLDDWVIFDNIFCFFYIVKGICGFLGLLCLEVVVYVGEILFGKFCDGELQVILLMVMLVFELIDQIKVLFEFFEVIGFELAGDDQFLIKCLEDVVMGKFDDVVFVEVVVLVELEVLDDYDQDLGCELCLGEVLFVDLEVVFQNVEFDVLVENLADIVVVESEEYFQVGDFDLELGCELCLGEVFFVEFEVVFVVVELDLGMELGMLEVIIKNMSIEEVFVIVMVEFKGGDVVIGEGGLCVQ